MFYRRDEWRFVQVGQDNNMLFPTRNEHLQSIRRGEGEYTGSCILGIPTQIILIALSKHIKNSFSTHLHKFQLFKFVVQNFRFVQI